MMAAMIFSVLVANFLYDLLRSVWLDSKEDDDDDDDDGDNGDNNRTCATV
jgi:hypothetical protein